MTESTQEYYAGVKVSAEKYIGLTPVADPIRVFIGYDPAEINAYHVLSHSIIRRSTTPVSITPVALRHLEGIMTRARDEKQSTEFSFSRFLVPWMCDFQGWAIFMDSDMLCRSNIARLWMLRDYRYAVQVVKHNYTPKTRRKNMGNQQTVYDRKNWSSVMLFNCSKCKRLTLKYVNQMSGLDLHQFNWVDEDVVGELPREWNWLVGEYPYNKDARLVHFTLGGPWWPGFDSVDYADEWLSEANRITRDNSLRIGSETMRRDAAG